MLLTYWTSIFAVKIAPWLTGDWFLVDAKAVASVLMHGAIIICLIFKSLTWGGHILSLAFLTAALGFHITRLTTTFDTNCGCLGTLPTPPSLMITICTIGIVLTAVAWTTEHAKRARAADIR
ncbi:MAG: hypothetical protein PF961_01575 [Planctomycetota bacterium]|nr:hypothetical protein [Planctomycetota bacterium]